LLLNPLIIIISIICISLTKLIDIIWNVIYTLYFFFMNVGKEFAKNIKQLYSNKLAVTWMATLLITYLLSIVIFYICDITSSLVLPYLVSLNWFESIITLVYISVNFFLVLICIIAITWLFDKKNIAVETSLSGMVTIISIFFLSGIIIHILKLLDFLSNIQFTSVSPFTMLIFILILVGIIYIFSEKIFIKKKEQI
jgi:hypothetical protein